MTTEGGEFAPADATSVVGGAEVALGPAVAPEARRSGIVTDDREVGEARLVDRLGVWSAECRRPAR